MSDSPKTILISGCSSGFGHDLVPALLERGYRVIATYRFGADRESLFRAEKERYGDRFVTASLDVTDAKDRDAILGLVTSLGGRLDCLVNNAGFGLFGALEDLTETQMRYQIEVNFFGTAFLTRLLLPALRRARGRVINVSSLLGFFGMPLSSLYSASKFAVEGLSECLYYELLPHGVQVAIVEPGGFRTRFAEKLKVGEGASDVSSPYRAQNEAYALLRAKWASGRGTPPEKVVETIASLVGMTKMPLRVRVGHDSGLVYRLRRLLPEGVFRFLLSRAFQKSFGTRGVTSGA